MSDGVKPGSQGRRSCRVCHYWVKYDEAGKLVTHTNEKTGEPCNGKPEGDRDAADG